ncbi:CocE/NonD family hydrolase [Hoeflea sp. CAU 1731]
MFDFFAPTHRYGSQVLRLVAESQQGGGDVFDIARLCRTIELDDDDGWEAAWVGLARDLEQKAHDAITAGNKRTATQHFFHANQYYRMADVFLTSEREARKRELFLKAQQNFRAGAALISPRIEEISVKCGEETYDGYFCHPHNPTSNKWPAVFLIGGADAYAEEIYFSGRQVLDRGWALLLVDTPGRGSSIYVKGIPTRADYEIPGIACIDWLMQRSEIDPERVALMGISMAGYYAPRVAAFDDRLKALVCWSGCYSILDNLYDFAPRLRPTVMRLLGDVDHDTARERLRTFTMEGLAEKIRCPTYITHGTEDALMDWRGAEQLYREIGAADKTLKLRDGKWRGAGTNHCSHNFWAHNVPDMLDWLEERL